MTWLPPLLALALALVHAAASRVYGTTPPSSRWLSFGGGVSVSFVFLDVLPRLEEARHAVGDAGIPAPVASHPIYLVALAGLVAFYGLARAATHARERTFGVDPSAAIFYAHMLSFALYNGLIGYLLVHSEDDTPRGLLLYFGAMALHLLVNDVALRREHRRAYDRIGRWLLSAAVLAGWALGQITQVDDATVGLLFAVLAGGLILNVLKEELPDERNSNFPAFALGAAGYALAALFTGR